MGDILCNSVVYNHLDWVSFPNPKRAADTYSSPATAGRYTSVGVTSLLFEHNATLKKQCQTREHLLTKILLPAGLIHPKMTKGEPHYIVFKKGRFDIVEWRERQSQGPQRKNLTREISQGY